ncbi:MAG TPA: TonB family protein [Candidatus Rubrimentiphilum sp.]|nr:TonB family protein [Candidatus Rubrimentiphilum sp.]
MKFFLLAIFLGSFMLSAARDAKAADEFCASWLYLKPVGVTGSPYTGTLYGFTLNAGAPKTVSAVLAFETELGWYSVAIPPVAIASTTHHVIEPNGKHRAVPAWTSSAMYLQFSHPVSLMNAFVLGANGQACPPQPRWALMPKSRGPATIGDPQYPDKTTLAPEPGDLVLPPKPAKLSYNTNCAEPFHDAGVKTLVSPDYPEPLRHGNQGTAQILVTINPGGSLADATLFQSSQDINFDNAAVRAARESTYQSAMAYCQPIPGSYLFKVTFQ